MRSDEEIKNYKEYLRVQIERMSAKGYGNCNLSLLDTYKIKLETLCFLTRQDDNLKDKLSVCTWLVR